MKINFFLLLSVLLFSQCNSEKKSESEKPDQIIEEDTLHEEKNKTDFSAYPLHENVFPVPYMVNYDKDALEQMEFHYNKDSASVQLRIGSRDSTVEEIDFKFEELIARISTITFNNNYHQQLSVYLFEKQWHSVKAETKPANESILYYEVVNSPHSSYWELNAVSESNGAKSILASYAFELPQWIYADLFKKVNNRDFSEYKNSLFNAPENKKIEYNSLRKMGKFYEGVLAALHNLPYDAKGQFSNSLAVIMNKPKDITSFYSGDFFFPSTENKGAYDTTNPEKKSLHELYAIKSFAYKTAYALNNPNDSFVEMQIDFKTKENQATVRFVIGGVVLSEVPKLKADEMQQGLYLSLGFHPYKNKDLKTESYVLMGNTSGLWIDNLYGRNIDGVMLHMDKNSKTKIHIWLMSGDGTIPVGHFVTPLEKLF